MTQADSVHSTPPTNTPILPQGLIQQQRQREKSLKRIAKLRKKAADEIERLILFMDATDSFTLTEHEEAVDDVPCDDNELDGAGEVDHEPSLGSSGHASGGPISYAVKSISDGLSMQYDCEGDEHDGREPDVDDEPSLCGIHAEGLGELGDTDLERQCEDEGAEADTEDDRSDLEPSLGWTIDGGIQNTSVDGIDFERNGEIVGGCVVVAVL